MPQEIAEARAASTILLLREGETGVEVFMVKRHHKIDFASGALVFPGGSLDPGDADPALRDHTAGCEELDDEATAFRVAAIRECFEEAGVLLAYDAETGALIDGKRYDELDDKYRAAVTRDEVTMGALAKAENLVFACDRLVPFGHWITPEFMPKRFDTWFFLARAPLDHLAAHDEEEVVDSLWIRPADALAAHEEGRYVVVFATRQNLEKLDAPDSIEEALEKARSETIVDVMPWIEKKGGTAYLTIPDNAGYEKTQAPVDDVMGKYAKREGKRP